MKTILPNGAYGFIYKTTLPDGRYYIGQHKIISQHTLDPTYFGSGVIIKDFLKSKGSIGVAREILEYGFSRDEMNILEGTYVTASVLSDPLNINLDIGGRNNYTRCDVVNGKISVSMAKARAQNPTAWPKRTGKENNKSVNWRLISPSGEVFVFCGDLSTFCSQHNISVNTIKKAVIEGWIPKRGLCAGWRAFNEDSGAGTVRETKNHGELHSGQNNPWYKHKKDTE
jgi:hypothetical protein